MVSKAYMLERPPAPGLVQRFVDQRLIPAMLNAIAPAEAALYRVSEQSKHNPPAALLAAFACGYALRLAVTRARPPHGWRARSARFR